MKPESPYNPAGTSPLTGFKADPRSEDAGWAALRQRPNLQPATFNVEILRLARWLAIWVCLGAGLPDLERAAAATNIQEAASQTDPMADVIRSFQADQRNVSDFFDLAWSETRFNRMERHYQDWEQRLQAMNFKALDQEGRIDYLLLRNKLHVELTRLKLARRRLVEMGELIPFRTALQELEKARWQMQGVEAPAAARAVAAVPEQIKKLRKRLEAGKKAEDKRAKGTEGSATGGDGTNGPAGPSEKGKEAVVPLESSPLLAKRAAEASADFRGTLKRWFSFYDGFQPEFSWWLEKPYDEAYKAIEEYEKFLREDIAGLKGKDEDPLLGEALGTDALAEDLANEFIPYTPQELIAIGESEFAWCETEMRKAAAQMGFGEDWKAALAKVKEDYPPPGQQDRVVAGLAREAIQFMQQHDLVTVPALCEETWRLSMLSPEGQKTLPYAAYGGQQIDVAYAKGDMKNEDKLMAMRGNNRHFTRIVAAHELIPGHHLQSFNAQRHHSYRGLFSTPFLVEGWAVYCEFRLWDLGYGQTPEDKIGMLFWRMHRAARIIVSLKFHLGQMKPAEMVDFLVDRVGHEKLGATSEVRRFIGGSYAPLYQCGYMIGALQLRALHDELVPTGRLTEKQFNDAVLTYNAIPVELIRAGMINSPLAADQTASWKFSQ